MSSSLTRVLIAALLLVVVVAVLQHVAVASIVLKPRLAVNPEEAKKLIVLVKGLTLDIYGVYPGKTPMVVVGRVTFDQSNMFTLVTSQGWGLLPGSSIEGFQAYARNGHFRMAGIASFFTGYAAAFAFFKVTDVRPVNISNVATLLYYIPAMYTDPSRVRVGGEGFWKKFNAVLWGLIAGTVKIISGVGYAKVAAAFGSSGGVAAGYMLAITGVAFVATSLSIAAFGETKIIFVLMPVVIVKDVQTGKYYAVSVLLTSEDLADFFNNYREHLENAIKERLSKALGIPITALELEPRYIARTSDELIEKFRSGAIADELKKLRLADILYYTVILRYNVPSKRLVYAGGAIAFGVIAWVVRGAFFGQLKRDFEFEATILPAEIRAFLIQRVIRDPEQICRMVEVEVEYYRLPDMKLARLRFKPPCTVVMINGKRVAEVRISSLKGWYIRAIRILGLPEGSVIDYEARWDVDIYKLCDCDETKCVCRYHHIPNAELRLVGVELGSMPSPVVLVERIYRYRWGTVRHIVYINESYLSQVEPLMRDNIAFDSWKRLGNMFEMTSAMTINGERRVFLSTVANTPWIDPTNGGTLQRCEDITFLVWRRMPPDAGVVIYFNGTKTIATQPVHITIVVRSNVNQTVSVTWRIEIQTFNYTLHNYTVFEVYTGSRSVAAGPAAPGMIILDAAPYIEKAVELIRGGIPTIIVVKAWITGASVGNYFETNDYDEKVLPLLPTWAPVKNITVTVFVYDLTTGRGIANATVEIYKLVGNKLVKIFSGTTNASGYMRTTLATGVAYLLRAYAAGYRDPNRAVLPDGREVVGRLVILSNYTTIIRYGLLPVTVGGLNYTFIVNPPGNWTHAPYPIRLENGTVFWVLAVQVTYEDGAPFPGALVEIYDAKTGALLLTSKTNGTGFTFFYIKNCTWANIHVVARVGNMTYEWWRNDTHVNRALWLVFTLPRKSPMYVPEIGIQHVDLVVHAGRVWNMGNITHYGLVVVYTNYEQTAELTFLLVNIEENKTYRVLAKSYKVHLGTNIVEERITVPYEGHWMLCVNISRYEADTDKTNNYMCSKPVSFIPYTDISLLVIYRPVKQKIPLYILPGDVVEIDVGVRVRTSGLKTPVKFTVNVTGIGWVRRHVAAETRSEIVKFALRRWPNEKIVWHNFTIVVPWSREIIINVAATAPGDVDIYNNNATITIPVSPEVQVLKLDVPRAAREGQYIRARAVIRNNLGTPFNISVVLLIDGKVCARRLYTVTTENYTVEITAKLPLNPARWLFMREPVVDRNITVYIAAPDVYPDDNSMSKIVTVLSTGTIFALAGLALALIAVLLLLGVLVIAAARRRAETIETEYV